MSSNFNFFLNRQGVRGNKGEQGEQGYSPRITVKTETAAEYVLNVQNEDGSFDTPNLRGNAIENLGGTYVRFDQDTEQMYTGYADTASTTSQGEVVLSTYEDLTSGGDESEVTTSKDVYDFVEAKISEASVNYVDIDDYTQKMGELDGKISDLDDNKLDFTDLSNTLVAGTNITITPNTQTGKITIAGEPVSQAQADWNQDDTSAPDYIKNKPTIPEAITVDDDFSTTSTNPVENRLITNAINLISNELEDFAEKDLSNLSANGEARLHALKAYSDNGEILTDTKGLSNVIGYAHSTFDSSKFTVVGSPVITSDGIASGFSNSNYLTTNLSSVLPSSITSVTFECEFIYRTGFSTIFGCPSGKNNSPRIHISNDAVLHFYLYDGTDDNDPTINLSNIAQNGDTIKARVTYSNTNVTGSLSINGGTPITISNNRVMTVNFVTSLVTIAIGHFGSSYSSSSIDLKQLSITIDGVPVFSGNKTGIDTIKPDNYTAVGSPTISADGVLSNYSTSNYLSKTVTLAQNEIKVRVPFKITSAIPTNTSVILVETSPNTGKAYIDIRNINGSVYGRSFIADGTINGFASPRNHTLELNVQYVAEAIYNIANHTNTLNIYKNGALFDGTTFTLSNALSNWISITSIDIAKTDNNYCEIDLNGIQVYGDGNLVYQPCLKIPYTQSKTGSKIVNAAYRDRVNDTAEQFGYANYYTLDEGNGNFTLPQIELYGLIERAASTVPSGVVQSSSINNIVSLTQTEYDNLATKDANTFYIITPSS